MSQIQHPGLGAIPQVCFLQEPGGEVMEILPGGLYCDESDCITNHRGAWHRAAAADSKPDDGAVIVDLRRAAFYLSMAQVPFLLVLLVLVLGFLLVA
jgi:hypothetical protein